PSSFFFNYTTSNYIYTLSLHDALPIFKDIPGGQILGATSDFTHRLLDDSLNKMAEGPTDSIDYKEVQFNYALNKLPKVIDYLERSEEHTSELQSRFDLVCRLLLEKKKI